MSFGSSEQSDRLLSETRQARQLPREHQNLLAQIGTQEGVIEDWPDGVQNLYRSIREAPSSEAALAHAAAVWLDGLRTVAFNAPLMHATTAGLTDAVRKQLVAYIAWHEYGHALSLTRSTYEQRKGGVWLLGLLTDGMRASIAYPGGYDRLQVFDEVIATVYTLLISRIRTDGYGVPEFLHPEIAHAFKEVIPWPPSH
jgi:hypothetical protein